MLKRVAGSAVLLSDKNVVEKRRVAVEQLDLVDADVGDEVLEDTQDVGSDATAFPIALPILSCNNSAHCHF